MRQHRTLLIALLLLVTTSAVLADESRLTRELERLAATAGGSMGVAVVHLESGRSAFVNADEPYPMASTYKVPLAVELLHQVDAGKLALTQRVDIGVEAYSPGSGMLAKLLDDPGLSVSVLNLLEIMLLISDNTATDRLLDLVGGGTAVNARLDALGVRGVRVDRPTIRLIGDWLGLGDMPSASGRTWEDYEAMVEALPAGEADAAAAAFELDPRDTATPRGMATLLEKIWKREALTESSSALLLDIMERCETGQTRLKGILPQDTVVAHKTGSIGRTTNDVGIVYLPGEAGHVIVVAFVKSSGEEVEVRERAIAEVARAAHDYFLFSPSE
ncbi:MAG: class A beta-lactamase [Gammaproteobacteria bacterium]|nr:class A beta-lactamase [Gammaproteobacteria bacterium]MDH4256484.1 class A beta-lactamase [Gammaproteobacteria bacterium]MDH5311879.1 class A beta-lactamase [Gammaproteobacteria bacterium]